jgi:hypothetical protein
MKKQLLKYMPAIFIAAVLILSTFTGCIKIEMAGTPTPKPTISASTPKPETPIPVPTGPTSTPQPAFTPAPVAPQITAFSASPNAVKQGDSVTLSWAVTGATQVDILPNIGTVNQTGQTTVKPGTTTIYQISAQNQAGKTEKSATVTVTPLVLMPDLVVTSIFMQVNQVYFKVKNIGTAPSAGTRAKLYVNDAPQEYGDTYVDPLQPGEEKTEIFGLYNWTLPVTTGPVYNSTKEMVQYEVKVVVDENNVVAESNENNNSNYLLVGQTFVYAFVNNASQADWESNSGTLILPVGDNNAGGNVLILGNVLSTYPAKVNGGWISGHFSDKYTDWGFKSILAREIILPGHCIFTSKVGFDANAPATAKARLYFTVLDKSLTSIYSRYIDLSGPKAEFNLNLDLSSLAGKPVTFILRVESQGTPGGDLAVWTNPQITQK